MSTDRLLEAPDACLRFDHLQDAGLLVKTELVDAAALAKDAEAHLVGDLPARSAVSACPLLEQPCVIGVEQSIQIAAPAPHDVQDGGGVQCLQHAANGRQRVSIDVAALHVGDRRLADSGPGGQVDLSPSAALAKRSNGGPDPAIVHRHRIHAGAYRPLTCQLPMSGGLGGGS